VLWRPSRSTGLALSVVSIFVALAGAYGALMVAFGGSTSRRLTLTLGDVALTVLILAAALLAHEGVHGLAISAYGGTPRFGWSFVARIVPQFYCTATGQRFSRVRYAIVALAPSVFVSLALIVGLRSSAGGLFVIPFAIHLGVCMNDWVVAFRAAREPEGSLIEDVSGGILVHPPASAA
jgi:hypothetical protein